MTAIYDTIGQGYGAYRREDPRLRQAILDTLGMRRVVNIGAGAGSYEPTDRFVVGVEPLTTMIRQRQRDASDSAWWSLRHETFPNL